VDHLIKCNKQSFPKSTTAQKAHLARTKCSMIIKNVWCPYFKKDLKKDIGNSFYSLLIDESTDISVVKYLGISIIYFSYSTNVFVTTFFALVELNKCDAQSIVDTILTVLKGYDLQLNRMRGLGTDNASVMVGCNSGVYQRLKLLNPAIILIPCVCHSLQLAVSDAAKECLPRNVDFMIKSTYNWFSKSSGRQSTYAQLYQLINNGHNPRKIVQACKTRWLSIDTAVVRIVQQHLELKTHFSIVRTRDHCYIAEQLYQNFKDDCNLAYLLFLKSVLGESFAFF
jgi:hypothetical protein